MALTKRAARKAQGQTKAPPPKRGGGGGATKINKATFDIAKKKEVGVSDLTLLSKVTDEAINDNLKKRFENGTIYTYIGHVVSTRSSIPSAARNNGSGQSPAAGGKKPTANMYPPS